VPRTRDRVNVIFPGRADALGLRFTESSQAARLDISVTISGSPCVRVTRQIPGSPWLRHSLQRLLLWVRFPNTA